LLLNTWKHHAGALRMRIRQASVGGDAALDELAKQMVVIGTELMDLYHGQFTPRELGEKLIAKLNDDGLLGLARFSPWVKEAGGYRVLTLDDDSRWVLRLGDESGLYVHAHPGRWAPRTCRVRANVLKTAAIVLAHVGVHGGQPQDLKLVNEIRTRYLGLAPLGRMLKDDQGIGEIIELLRT
jgi:hypothetical protein